MAVIGAGIAGKHLVAYAKLPRLFDVRAICTASDPRMLDLASDYSIPLATTSLETIVENPEIDVVDICTPPRTHFDIAKAALAHGKHVICEKPVFSSLEEIDEIARLAIFHDRRVMPIFQYRFGGGLYKLTQLMLAGIVGPPYVATAETHWRRDRAYYDVSWRGKWKEELGGCLVGHAIHAHDIICQVLGPCDSLHAFATTRVNAIEVEDCAAVAMKMQSGALASLSVTLGACDPISRLRFCFENVTAESCRLPSHPAGDPWTFTARSQRLQGEVDRITKDAESRLEGYARQFELFHAALTSGADLPVKLEEARASLELITAMYDSMETGRSVKLPLSCAHPKYGAWTP